MPGLTNPELIHLLACPDCGGDLLQAETALECPRCSRRYEIRNGIPILYPRDMNTRRLREEENLAEMMKRPPSSRKERFSSLQWSISKDEFWGMVRKSIASPPGSFINIGCGYDACFREFEQQGYVFVNFDIVYDMPYTLQTQHGARSCVAGDINSLPFKKNSFDYVVCIDVVHHESDKLPVLLKSFCDLLKPGGSLFLEDLNAWGMFRLPKSLLFPRPLYRLLRSTCHRLKHSSHKPADYEFPTNLSRVKVVLEGLGFSEITVYPNIAYPNIGPASYRIYRFFSRIERVRKCHNYHYMLSARKVKERGPGSPHPAAQKWLQNKDDR